MAADILTKSTHALVEWVEARKQINVFTRVEELMPFATSSREVKAHIAIACLQSQSFGSEARKGGVDSAEPLFAQLIAPWLQRLRSFGRMPIRPLCEFGTHYWHSALIAWAWI